MLIEFLLGGLLQCMALQDLDEFGACLDEVVLEFNQSIDDWISEMAIATN